MTHENQTRLGAFKIRGGLTFCRYLGSSIDVNRGIISATRGNHGQSLAHAASRFGMPATIIVPHGNSVEKNAAMRAWGAEVIEHGHDFQEAAEYAKTLAASEDLVMVPPFHRELVRGVASYGLELFDDIAGLDRAGITCERKCSEMCIFTAHILKIHSTHSEQGAHSTTHTDRR